MKFCQNCGFQMAANLTNCPKCGAVQQMGVSPAPVGQPAQYGQMGPMPVPYAQPTVDNRSKILWILLIVTIIGAINWGLIGLLDFNLVEAIFGSYQTTVVDDVPYLLYCFYIDGGSYYTLKMMLEDGVVAEVQIVNDAHKYEDKSRKQA